MEANKCVNTAQDMTMKQTIFLIVAMLFLVIGTPASAQHCNTQKGDSMWRIAKRYKIPFSVLLELNKHFPNQDLIHPNDKIIFPEGEHGQSTIRDNNQEGVDRADPVDATQQAKEVLELVNKERLKVGLNSLELSNELTDVATLKAQDMRDNNYFDHTSPRYGSPFEMMRHFGVQYTSAGENIAAGQKTAEEVMNSWMNSSGHRANILNEGYREIGIGYVEGGSYGTYWVQMFKK